MTRDEPKRIERLERLRRKRTREVARIKRQRNEGKRIFDAQPVRLKKIIASVADACDEHVHDLLRANGCRGLMRSKNLLWYVLHIDARLGFCEMQRRFGMSHTTYRYGVHKHCSRYGLPVPKFEKSRNRSDFSLQVAA